MVFGGCIFSFPTIGSWVLLSGRKLGQQNGILDPDGLLPLVFFGPFCFPLGGLMLFWGLHIVAGRTEIDIRSARLRVLYKCGPFGLPRRMWLDKIRVFRLDGDSQSKPTAIAQPTNLFVESTSGKSIVLCVGYPRDWLLRLASDLARRCQQIVEHENPHREPIVVAGDRAIIQERPQQPGTSTAILEQQPNGFRITIPPPGMLKGSSSSFVVWCLVWNGMMCLMAPLFLYAAFQGEVKWAGGDDKVSILFMCCFLAPFVLIGMGTLIVLYTRGRHCVVISVADQSLEVLARGFVGTRSSWWQSKDLLAIGALREKQDGANEEGEYVTSWTVSLGIQTARGEITRLLTNRDQAELEWIATELRRSLQLPWIDLSATKIG
jgi:hypothetical protein